MLVAKKDRSSPQLVSILGKTGPHTSKPRKRYLQQLEGEVNKSRIAIDNMSHTCAIESSLVKKVDELQKELHHCILSINQQSQRQRTFLQLNAVLKGQMNEVQAVQRNQQQYESNTFEKKSKKVEYDIKQILHKYNEEVAKINCLKEMANAARDERVVYSNLFNKIEKEIKHYQQLYKQTVIRNQIFIDKKRVVTTVNPQSCYESGDSLTAKKLEGGRTIRNGTSREGVTTINELVKSKQISHREPKRSLKIETDQFFLTNIKENKTFKEDVLRTPHNKAEIRSSRMEDTNAGTNIHALIREKERQIDRIVVAAECKNLTEVLQLYQSVQQENDQMKENVQLVDQRINFVQEQIQRIKRQKRSSNIQQRVQNLHITQKVISQNREDQQQKEQTESAQQITLAILNTLNLHITQQKPLYSDELIKEIDMKVDELGCCPYERKQRKDSKILSVEDMNNVSDRGISQLLQKIQRFNQSERLMDRNSLKLEYTRELNKVRKKLKKNN